jgi:tripartite-type tricarboxylate transporter receptor subunit TctC
MFIQYAVARPHVAAGTIRVLATPSSKRLAAVPDVPTVAESGLPGFSVEPWFGVVAPAHTPKAVIDKVHAGLVEAMRSPDVVKRLDQLGGEAMATSPDEFNQLIEREVGDWRKIIVDAKIRLE